ncbi:CyP450 monooxygenase [Trametes coccinea BRFM310]|uniref:CyP450 monooxygenase n=1 Tax=Trametes coccinea (strain BRFM310) TaxID=1353009 RepID=A0A1Y2J5P5_TRAC3|nr:CyP450 monooxygenase [Trametes coccinea BRFM310]
MAHILGVPSPIACLAVIALFLWRYLIRTRRSRTKLPPGPPGLPIIGNLLDVPTKQLAAGYRKLSENYGDLVFLDAFGQPILVLGSHATAVDLLEKRSALYSDRLPTPMVELGGFEWVLTVLRYGPWWRRHRRAFHQFFNINAVAGYRALQRAHVGHFLCQLLKAPEGFSEHIRHLFGATISRIAYGREIKDENDEFVKLAEDSLAAFNVLLAPGKYLVELFPSLRYVPAWFPGAGFQREAKQAKAMLRDLVRVPWDDAVAAIMVQRDGTAPASMTATLLDQLSQLSGQEGVMEEKVARHTTLSSIQAFFLVMAGFPDAQKKAQAELDSVVGSKRLPDFSDQEALPYVSALIKECLRWHPVLPLAVPHRLVADDKYRGYLIPKGTLVIPNVWAFSRDHHVYPDPFDFKPERFLKAGKLDPNVLDPLEYVFGYGRRICPGRHFAEASLFLIVSSVLHTLCISPPVEGDGRPLVIRPEIRPSDGLISYPEPFDCVIKPRASWAEQMLLDS